jgi:cyclophilin family peptidyl-prolyl cis-trans isomerase
VIRRGRLRQAAFGAACLSLVFGCGPGDGAGSESDVHVQPNARQAPSASDRFNVRLETSKGDIVIAVDRAWAPQGADRFRALIESGYYDDARFHRVVPDFIVQWGLAGDPTASARWMHDYLPDDPVVVSNTRGRIAYAFTDPETRSTQVFISLIDNSRLDEQRFAPFGEVIEGMDVVDQIYSGYGEDSGGGVRRGDQSRIVAEGNAYLDAEFPLLDHLIRATIEDVPDPD